MLRIVFIVLAACMSLLTGRLVAGDQPRAEDEFMKVRIEYADVLALQGTAKGEILAIARISRANPKMAIDQTAASGEYCLNSGLGYYGSLGQRLPTRRVQAGRDKPRSVKFVNDVFWGALRLGREMSRASVL